MARFDRHPRFTRRSAGRCLVGCLISGVLAVVLIVLTINAFNRAAKREVIETIHDRLVRHVEDSALDPEQKRRAVEHIDAVAEAARAARLSLDKLKRFRDAVVQSPVFSLAIVWYVHREYVPRSGLSEAEQDEASRQVQRFVRGVLEGRIETAAVHEARQAVTAADDQGRRRLKPALSDHELRRFVTRLRRHADAASVPDEPFFFDPVDSIRRLSETAQRMLE